MSQILSSDISFQRTCSQFQLLSSMLSSHITCNIVWYDSLIFGTIKDSGVYLLSLSLGNTLQKQLKQRLFSGRLCYKQRNYKHL